MPESPRPASWTKQQFMIGSGVLGAVVMFAAFFGGVPLLPAIGFAFAAGFGLPRWLLAFSRSAVKRSFSMPCQMPST
jgi:tight adherence protein B